jgi:hypothetical protein
MRAAQTGEVVVRRCGRPRLLAAALGERSPDGPAPRGRQVTGPLPDTAKGRLDFGGEEVEVELAGFVRGERVEAEPFPPGASSAG